MALVRIITRLKEYPTELVRDLRTRGYEVETCLYQDEKQETADLEITLDQCSTENMSESISHALANKDVVIVAGAKAGKARIRSIGMVLMNSEASLQTDRKTSVPVQFNEIYTALLHGRLQARESFYRFNPANVEARWQKTVLVTSQRFNAAWKYGRTVGKNLGELGTRTASEVGIWAKSKKLDWNAKGDTNSSKFEPDLVPSMFNLSGFADESNEPAVHDQPTIRPVSTRNEAKSRLWKPITVGAVAIFAITLWVHGFSHPRMKADGVSADKKEAIAVSRTSGPAVQVVQKVSPVTKMLARSNAGGDDDSFQEVVVRHLAQPAPKTLQKDGIKRRVVVD
jgi:hypothetical protein